MTLKSSALGETQYARTLMTLRSRRGRSPLRLNFRIWRTFHPMRWMGYLAFHIVARHLVWRYPKRRIMLFPAFSFYATDDHAGPTITRLIVGLPQNDNFA